jgi:hypothetical protein
METQMIQGSPCPLCGECSFALESRFPSPETSEYAYLWDQGAAHQGAYLQPYECIGCGNVQLVVTRSLHANLNWTALDDQEVQAIAM